MYQGIANQAGMSRGRGVRGIDSLTLQDLLAGPGTAPYNVAELQA
jgi:hypothetical protein